ncbi:MULTISPECIES: hypothetical protein [unclassified Rhizobacter]|uniref:hypothetical protein n=1 Tax=unclassified Rhizobacter TaxID=2640088 RepID=UPI000A676E1A|nr:MULTISPECIES: hypothetical protein [unclassified Rhizobacter]
MDWLTFISKAIDSLAWPFVALVLGIAFRKKVLDLLPLIKKLKAGPLEAEFELAAKQILANAAEAAPPVMPEEEKVTNDKNPTSQETVAQLISARDDPSGTILKAWGEVNGELFRLGHQMGTVVDPLESTNKVYLAAMEILPIETLHLVQKLRELRNQVAHAEVAPTPESAQDFLLAANRVIELIYNFRKNLPNYGAGLHSSPTSGADA